MGYVIAFSTTAGIKNIFPATPVSNSFFETSGISTAYPTTISENPFFETSGIKYAFTNVISQNSFFQTSGTTNVFTNVIDIDTSKELKLKFGPLEVDSNYATVTLVDNTGTYDATTNPGGYNPEDAVTNPNRAKRSEVKLWLAYRVWTDTNVPDLVFPTPSDPTETNWEYTLPIDDFGVYQFFLIASPVDKTFEDVAARGNSAPNFAYDYPEWYMTNGGSIIDPDVINCINKSRYGFIESVMCGSCDEDYLLLYSKYIGALSAFEIGTNDAYIQGMTLIQEIKEECNKIGCNCNC